MQLVGQIAGTNAITFSEDELTPEGTGHVRTLYIAIKMQRYDHFNSFFINNGSALNIYPVMTLSRIGVNDSLVRLNGMMIRASDGTKASLVERMISKS